jgi:RNA polymerase sigma factor (sigma-70 family)
MTMGVDAVDGLPSATTRREADRLLVVELQARRGPELYGLSRRLGLTAEEADDAVQETLLRAWIALDGDEPIRQLDAWTFRTLYRLCMDGHRWRRRLRTLTDRLEGGPASEPAPAVADRLVLWAAVDRLPPRQRAIVYLRYRADLSFDEIGEILDIQAVSARSHASRALDRLAQLLRREDFR